VEIAAPDSAVLFLCALNFANSAFFRKKIAILARGTLLFSSQSFIVQKIHHCTTNVELTLLPARA